MPALCQIYQVLVGFLERVRIDLVHRVWTGSFNDPEAVQDHPQVLRPGMFRVGQPFFVEVLDQILALMGGEVRVVNGGIPVLLCAGVQPHEG